MATAKTVALDSDNVFIEALAGNTSWTRGDTIRYFLDPGTIAWSTAGAGTAFLQATQAWSAVANIRFEAVDKATSADIVERLYSDPDDDVLGSHDYPIIGGGKPQGMFNAGRADIFNAASNRIGGDGFLTFLHELGHALGLDHPFDGNPLFPGVTDSTTGGDNNFNNTIYTVMAYEGASSSGETAGWSATPMAFDIAAIQAIYGPNTTTATGNDVYVIPPLTGEGSYLACIWDAGGVDTISAAGQVYGCTIDLRAATLNDEQGGGGFFSGTGYPGWSGLSIAHGVTIENAIGSEFDDMIAGNSADNVLDGGAGSDTLTGYGGHDTFVVSENGSKGADFIGGFESGIDRIDVGGIVADFYTIRGSYLENGFCHVTFHAQGGDLHFNVSGTIAPSDFAGLMPQYDVQLVGRNVVLAGFDFDDRMNSQGRFAILTGGDGDDSLFGGLNARLSGDDGDDLLAGSGVLSGGNGADRLRGGAGRDSLDGGTGHDTMSGGLNDDSIIVDSRYDKVKEKIGEGDDTVFSSVSYGLADNVENLTLTGHVSRTGSGNALDNVIRGTSASCTLAGGDGADTLVGGKHSDFLRGDAGADRLIGGGGNDRYTVDDAGDVVVEKSHGGRDTVYSTISVTLSENVENLTLKGDDAISGTGNSLANAIEGNAATNKLSGLAGDDVLTGGGGRDYLLGGGGADRFVFHDGDFGGATQKTSDRIIDFSRTDHDAIDLSAIDGIAGKADSAFGFIGGVAFGHHAGELRAYASGGNSYVAGDTDGDGAADFVIRVDGSHHLVAADFVL